MHGSTPNGTRGEEKTNIRQDFFKKFKMSDFLSSVLDGDVRNTKNSEMPASGIDDSKIFDYATPLRRAGAVPIRTAPRDIGESKIFDHTPRQSAKMRSMNFPISPLPDFLRSPMAELLSAPMAAPRATFPAREEAKIYEIEDS